MIKIRIKTCSTVPHSKKAYLYVVYYAPLDLFLKIGLETPIVIQCIHCIPLINSHITN